jgi:Flp pilus assembly protein TadG
MRPTNVRLSIGRLLIGDRRASAAVETALSVPLILLFIFGAVDIANYLMTVDRVHRLAAASSDLLARAQTLHQSDVSDVLDAVAEMAKPLDIFANGGVIVSGVARINSDGGQRVRWQQKMPTNFGTASKVGAVDGAPSLPPGLALQDGDTIIFGETFYTFRPFVFSKGLFGLGDPSVQLYAETANRPRLGTLYSVLP